MTDAERTHDVTQTASDHTGDDVQPYIEAYIEQLKQPGSLRSPAIEHAFRRVPRHRLMQSFYTPPGPAYAKIEHDPANPDPLHLAIIYSPNVLVTRLQDGVPTSSSSQPGLMAEMLELLELDAAGMDVLEIGAGTGYNAALMAEIVGDQARVTTVDTQPDVVAQTQALLTQAGYGGIRVRCADGFYGVSEAAPYDRVIVTVGSPDLSPHWVAQLKPSGQILFPLRHAGANPLISVTRRGGALVGTVVDMSSFMAIQGELHDGAYYGRTANPTNPPSVQVPVWPELYATSAFQGPSWQLSVWGFWFYLGIRDRRAWLANWMPSFGLADARSGQSVTLDREHITLAGEQALLDDVRRYYDEWRALGSPGIPDFTLQFVPMRDADGWTAQDRRWIVVGRYYARVFALD
jgi:protein-L-isoaspartate(D-aspartate) O-methyltransferase